MESIAQGTLVADRYRMIREIGFGGMGTVWLAYDEALDSHCALKLIGASQAKLEEFRIRFECEAKCAAQLRGAHVVDVLNRGEWQGKPFIVMEYLEGEDLAVRLARLGRLDARTTYRIVAQVARALMRAHALGIVHRDLKPGNVFLVPGDEHEIAKLLDFGVAKHRDLPQSFEGENAGQFIGTPCYMSPEQASGLGVDARSDLWALAVITFECLTGDVPFQEESMLDLIQAITHGSVPSLIANRPELPKELEQWWRRASARDPKRRFQSAKEFADSLAEAIGVYPLPVSGLPTPSADAPTVFDPFSVASTSRRAALVASAPGPRGERPGSYRTDAAVIMHFERSSSTAMFRHALRARNVHVFPYMVAAGALGAVFAFMLNAWRPALNEVASSIGLDAVLQPPLPKMAEMRTNAAALPTESHEVPAPSPVPEAVMTAGLSATTLPANTPEPTVLVVAEPRARIPNATLPVKKPKVVAPRVNDWEPLAPPAPLPPPLEKDYGI
jgi:serine/threonine protein kinase